MIEQAHSFIGRFFIAGSALAFAGLSHAGTVLDSYAVVSLIGDELSIVVYQPSVGSSFDRNIRQSLPMSDGHFDQLAARVAINTIHRAVPDAASQAIDVADKAAFGDANALLGSGGTLPALVTAVRPLLRQPDTHYLVVISKYRGDAQLKVNNGHVGSGKVSGLGFYLDSVTPMQRTNTGAHGRGFVAPFAYVMVSLVDLRTGDVIASQEDVETALRGNVSDKASLNPWEAMTPEQKVLALDRLVNQAVRQAVAPLVTPVAKDTPST